MVKISELADKRLIEVFVQLRDRRAQRKAAYAEDDSGDKIKQDKIEVEFLRRFTERDIDSVSVRDVGTAYMSTRTTATVADPEIYWNYIRENDAWELAENRVNKTAAAQHMEESGEPVPGVNISSTNVINFRRK
jgi:hypothetical protein